MYLTNCISVSDNANNYRVCHYLHELSKITTYIYTVCLAMYSNTLQYANGSQVPHQ